MEAWPETIRTDRLLLRPPRLADSAWVYENYARDPEVSRFVTWAAHTVVAQSEEFMRQAMSWDRTRHPMWMILLHDGTGIGSIDARCTGHQVEVGYVLGRSSWGHGYMTEALRAVRDAAFARPGVFRFAAMADADNVASQRVMTKIGMTFEGVLKAYAVHPNISALPRDVAVYAQVRTPGAT